MSCRKDWHYERFFNLWQALSSKKLHFRQKYNTFTPLTHTLDLSPLSHLPPPSSSNSFTHSPPNPLIILNKTTKPTPFPPPFLPKTSFFTPAHYKIYLLPPKWCKNTTPLFILFLFILFSSLIFFPLLYSFFFFLQSFVFFPLWCCKYTTEVFRTPTISYPCYQKPDWSLAPWKITPTFILKTKPLNHLK